MGVFPAASRRRHADPAADEQRGLAAGGDVKAVAKARQRPERLPRPTLRKPVGAFADDLVEDGHAGIIPVADGQRAAQEKARQLQLQKLPRRGDGRGVAAKAQGIDLRGKRPVLRDGKQDFFQSVSSFQTGSPPIIVSLHTPVSARPANGVARPMVRNISGSTV